MSTPNLDWYDVLGVDPGASDAEIGQAFRALARRYHPDTGTEASQGRFSDIARAWEVLGDVSSRASYDRYRGGSGTGGIRIPVRRWAAPSSQPPTVDGFVPADRDRNDRPEVEVAVSFAEAIRGTVTKAKLPSVSVCTGCGGRGQRPGEACRKCGGRGRHERRSGSINITHMCTDCNGRGASPPQPCATCGGRGWQESNRELTVRVPAGITDGTRLRLRWPGSGEAAGYARLRIRPDPWLSRDGSDLVLRLPLGLAEAALGCTVTARLPDGPVAIPIPAGTQPGSRLRVPGRGVTKDGSGDLVVHVELVVPRDLSPNERAALEALAQASPSPRAGLGLFSDSADAVAGDQEAQSNA